MHVRANPQQNSGTAMRKPEEIASVAEAVAKYAVTSTDQRLVCTMAMVCKDWRVTVQDEAPAGLLDVSLDVRGHWAPDAGMPSECMLKLASFSKWLPQHARLVRKLEITGVERPHQDNKDRIWFKALAETVFSLALRSAAATCIKTNAQQQMQPLGLQSYSSDGLDTSAVLQSLPAASLTELKICCSDRSALAAALPRLTNLQRLETYGLVNDKPMAAVLQAAQQLSALTELSFWHKYISSSDIKLVPPHLLRLQVHVLGSDDVDLSHVTTLTSLSIKDGSSVGYRFPAHLVALSLGDVFRRRQVNGPPVVSVSNISSLKCLESLHIGNSKENAEDLLQLVALPRLQKLSLRYHDTQTALTAAAAWPKLRQLQGVGLDLRCSSSDCMQVLCNVGKVTWLTQLDADIWLDEEAGLDEEQQAVPVAICSEICKLQMLQGLCIYVSGAQQSSWAQNDLAQLSRLTRLTKLDLYAGGVGGFNQEVINDGIVVQLLLNLKQLQELSVPVTSVEVLPVIAQLSNLRVLNLAHLPEAVQRSGLQFLKGMKSLTALSGFAKCSKQELADFWAAVRA